jgi:hypothetical protein
MAPSTSDRGCKPGELMGRPERLIMSQAPQGEGATTIPQGSRPQAIGGRSAGHPNSRSDDDIVSTAGEPAAAPWGGLGVAIQGEDIGNRGVGFDRGGQRVPVGRRESDQHLQPRGYLPVSGFPPLQSATT